MIELFAHNLTAYESAVNMLAQSGKAAIIHPTGTGKSFIAFKLCEDNADKRILWLSPSEYIFKTQIENLKSVSRGYAPKNIIFSTYAKLGYMDEDELAQMCPDYIILDEFHRCGARVWGNGVDNVLRKYADAPVLGLSATNIRYLDNQRDMADELFDGNVASEMTLGEAIVRGILNPPKYVLSLFQYQKDLEKYRQRVHRAKNNIVRKEAEKYLEALRRALEKADGLPQIFAKHMPNNFGKYILFCANVEHMEEMVSLAQEWFKEIDDAPHIYRAYSDDPETSLTFDKFKSDSSKHLKLLFCIDMLNEGVHVEDISGVILLRPTVSPIIYKQQIGRALSASKTTNAVIFDIVMNIDNLYSIGAVQDEMRVVMTYYREHGLNEKIVNENFKVVDEVRDCVRLFEKLNDTLIASWDYMFAEAQKYYEINGNLEIPKRYKTPEGYSLGSWLTTQRKVRNGEQFGSLSEDRIGKLDSIGMVWGSVKDLSWNRYFEAAKEYYAAHGHLKVPAAYAKKGIGLGAWIANLRAYRKNGSRSSFLTEDRISALDSIGMIWDVADSLWQRNYKAAKTYYERFGNLNVAVGYVDENGIKLGLWLNNLRNADNGKFKGYRITRQQKDSLNEIGMIWTLKYDRAWELGFGEAQEYYDANKNLNVAATYTAASGFKLGKWLDRQRREKQRLSIERISKLDSIDMVWEKPDSWEIRYALAKKYYVNHGDLFVPPGYVEDGIWLSKWLNEQKQIYFGKRKGKRLTQEQIDKLNSIHICWENKREINCAQAWDEMYLQAVELYERYGDFKAGDFQAKDGKSLKSWIARQKKAYKSGKLSQDKILKLAAIGVIEVADVRITTAAKRVVSTVR